MTDGAPTRSRLIALREEQRAMREGYVFLDEKCLVLAGAMLRELSEHDVLLGRLAAAQTQAAAALRAAVARHGLEGLGVQPPGRADGLTVAESKSLLIGVVLRKAELVADGVRPVFAAECPSPEAEACRRAFVSLTQAATALAASVGNLVRLQREYRRTVRRVASLHDVVLPEIERESGAIAAQLEELERDEALWVRSVR